VTISVIIPAYNAAAWLPTALRSVLAQTRRPEEIVVVDDGSTDHTAQVCAEFSANVRYVRRENGGLSAARNTGLAATTGEWFLSLDADDALYPHALATLEKTAASGRAGVVYGYVLQRRESALETRLHSLPYAVGDPPAPAKAAFWWTPVSTLGSALVRRDLNESVGGFDESFRQVEDAEYWLRCGVTTSFAHCDQIVLDKTFSSNSLGQQQSRSVWYRLQLQLKFLLWCRERGIDTGFLQTSRAALVDHALTRAWRQQDWALLEPLLEQAARENVSTLWCLRARARVALLKALRRLPPAPPYCREIYKDWLKPQNTPSAK
jgi:glycosyltransferase involved in cell wall biosynthesis